MQCCSEPKHAWDDYRVKTVWLPCQLRCLIIGENPGAIGATYFYDNSHGYDRDPVVVRRKLLCGLHKVGLIHAPTLDAFRDAGFLFDHAIRCHLPSAEVRKERNCADRYDSPRAKSATHLKSLVQKAPKVWVMGRVARNAVAALNCGLPEDWEKGKTKAKQIAKPPYPIQVPQENPRFFVSCYFTRFTSSKEVEAICKRFRNFL